MLGGLKYHRKGGKALEEMGIKFALMGKEYWIHDTVVNSIIITIGLIIFAFIFNGKLKKADPTKKPSGIVNVVELLYTMLKGLVEDTMGKGPTRDRIFPYLFAIVLFLPIANIFGLLGFSPPTSDYNVTLSFALITFVMTQYYGIKTNGIGGYIKGYFEPVPFLVPLNIVGEIANPISLSFRLFGNILSGGIIMSLLYQALSYVAPLITPAFHVYFDLFAGFVQTFIFLMLTMVFVGGNMPEEETA